MAARKKADILEENAALRIQNHALEALFADSPRDSRNTKRGAGQEGGDGWYSITVTRLDGPEGGFAAITFYPDNGRPQVSAGTLDQFRAFYLSGKIQVGSEQWQVSELVQWAIDKRGKILGAGKVGELCS